MVLQEINGLQMPETRRQGINSNQHSWTGLLEIWGSACARSFTMLPLESITQAALGMR